MTKTKIFKVVAHPFDAGDFILVPKGLLNDSTITASAKIVLMYLLTSTEQEHTYKSIAQALDLSVYGVRKMIQQLIDTCSIKLDFCNSATFLQKEKKEKSLIKKEKREKEEYRIQYLEEEEEESVGGCATPPLLVSESNSLVDFSYSKGILVSNSCNVGARATNLNDCDLENPPFCAETIENFYQARTAIFNSFGEPNDSFDITPSEELYESEEEKNQEEKGVEMKNENATKTNAMPPKIENNREGAISVLPEQKNTLKNDYSNVLDYVDSLDYDSKPLDFWTNITERTLNHEDYQYFLKPYKPKKLEIAPQMLDDLVEQVEYCFTFDGLVTKRPRAELRAVIVEMLKHTSPAHIYIMAHDRGFSFPHSDRYLEWRYEDAAKDYNYVEGMKKILQGAYYGSPCDYIPLPMQQSEDGDWFSEDSLVAQLVAFYKLICKNRWDGKHLTDVVSFCSQFTRSKMPLYDKNESLKLHYEYALAIFNKKVAPKLQAHRDSLVARGEVR